MANGYINNPWTAERTELLTKLVREGYSAGMIAAKLGGLTRNAVIGKAIRLGLRLGNTRNSMQRNLAAHLRLKANYQKRKRKADRLRAPVKVKFETAPLPPPHIEDVARKSFAELEPNDCRFPVGEVRAAGFGFCAMERVPGSSYCEVHRSRCIASVPVRARPEPVKARETAEVMG